MKIRLLCIAIIVGSISCNHNHAPIDIKTALESSGENRTELEKIIEHYRKNGDIRKLDAARFLIQNMRYRFYYDGEAVKKYDEIFDYITLLSKNKIAVNYTSHLQNKWDSLVRVYGAPSTDSAKVFFDSQKMKADIIIENIDLAFNALDSTAWGKNISFEDFCEYILPYRLGTERPEAWRKHLRESMKKVRDSTTARNRLEFTRVINNRLDFIGNHKVFWSYPFDMPASKMEQSYRGACKHQVYYATMVMRANGLPIGVDIVPTWANRKNGHEWTVLLMEDGSFFPFDACDKSFTVEYDKDRVIAKVFRETFVPYTKELPPANEGLPIAFYNQFRKDVTSSYKKTCDLKIPIEYPRNPPKKYALICTFNNKNWTAQYFGKISSGNALFENMGCGVAYMAMYQVGDSILPASSPFILSKNGDIIHLSPNEKKTQQMILTRKYPLTDFMVGLIKRVQGGLFQASNSEDYKDAQLLHKIDSLPFNYKAVILKNSNKFRYVRFCSPAEKACHIAEIEFYGLADNGIDTIKLEGKVSARPQINEAIKTDASKALDGDVATYFAAPKTFSWISIDLGTPQQIVKIRYCPHSDANFIEDTDSYELKYWKNKRWISAGKQTGKSQQLIFNNVPSGALYLLHDITKGAEERIFTYENGKQVFW